MTRRHQLKNEARKAEQRSDWARAIELYKTVIRLEDEGGSGPDVGIYNRIGDLYFKQGDTTAAVDYYEQAADHYASHDLHTSAIALCNKILRIAPGRDEVYGRLARLHASTGLLAESRSAFLRFAARMGETNRLSEALEAVQDLVTLTGDEELRTAFAEQLADADLTAQAVAQLRLVYEARVASGRKAQDIRDRIVALDPDADPVAGATSAPPRATPTEQPPVSDLDLQEVTLTDPEPPPVAVEAPDADAGTVDLSHVTEHGSEGFESVLTRFRSQVREIVEDTDHSVHYDLGIAYMGMGLLDDAVGEFRMAMQSPALAESAGVLLEECLRQRGEGTGGGLEDPAAGPGVDAEPGPSSPRTSDFMLGQTVDLDAQAAQEAAALDADSPAVGQDPGPPSESEAEAAADEEELAEMLFQARLAQHRTRTAADTGDVDHEAHLELGRSYWRMGLLAEAVGDLLVVLDGPQGLQAEALDLLEEVAFAESIEADVLRGVIACLMERERSDPAIRAGREFVRRPGIRESDRQAILALLPPEEPQQPPSGPEESASSAAHPREALADLGDIYAELDAITSDAEGAGGGVPASSGPVAADDPVAVFGEAEGLRAAGRMDEAASHYYRALEMFERQRDAINAIRAVDRLLGLRPDDVVLHHQKTEFSIMLNDRDLLVSSYLDLAACLRRQHGYRSARTVYGRILDLDPANAEARAGVAAVDADELARERRRQQQRDAAAAARPAPTSDAAADGAAPPTDEFDQMFVDLREEPDELNESPPDFESHYELGVAFRQMEMWDEAAREFKLAVQGMSEPLPAYGHLGECLLALRRYDEARRILGVAATLPGPDSDKAVVLFHLGVAHLRSDDPAAARACLERVLEFEPSQAEAAQLLSTLPA